MNSYRDWNDYELISLAQEHNEDAVNILHEKYQPLINKKSRKFFKYLQNKGVELSDLIQECTIGFEEAIQNFNSSDDVSFYTFANVCMDRQLMSELTRQNRDKYKFLNEAVPLETINEDNDTSNLIDFIQDNTNNPELGLLFDEEFKELYAKISKQLTELEECVFKLKLQAFSYKEIADILDKDEKSIDNAIQRIKTKIKNMDKSNLF
ncbi:MAG: sigma-70 family RNA polymerase sigma factor [Erysipelotrichaceae bacterium]|nr:sigma-70 family RNA polymerase sigma factor [Erysipelotrichaceae bacterium]